MIPRRDGWRYGLLGLPLAFAALPLYVHVPARYAADFGVPLTELGALLLAARLADAVLDPWIGRWIDGLYQRSVRHVLAVAAGAAIALAAGFALLLFPPVRGTGALLAWAAMSLAVTYFAFSVLSVAHQSWGAMLADSDDLRARIVAWREGLGLAGVLLAAVLPAAAGWPATTAVLALALACGCVALAASRWPLPLPHTSAAAWHRPLMQPAFRKLLAVFLANGIASAVPATLLLFFVRDRLQAPQAEGTFLGIYFACGAASLPLWLRVVALAGLARAWLAGMLLAIASFAAAMALGPGDSVAFGMVCAMCGIALGSDLAVPAALLAGVISRAREPGAVYFGWWNFASKLNLALAAGLALPLLQLAGYSPGDASPRSMAALTFAYCAVPCVLKAAAALLLYVQLVRTKEVP
ncbi:MFS transporter [Ramlibacter albus]|uniref:MFS transporter n=1 Tax=Ramlibacter albus TaxID=2079448 RepID=A0A923M9I0_9BURK|nr:MFS transporter [Ramlibacter albus]MBC5765239.1 MFS transporter [Ramlibacter albus]